MKAKGLFCLIVFGFCLWTGAGSSVLQAAPTGNPYSVAGIENAAEFEKAFSVLQAAIATDDRSKVADYILYPVRVNGWKDELKGKVTVQFETKPELLDNYEEIFTSQVKAAIAKQKKADLFVNWQGVMIGKGEVWMSVSEKEPRRYGIFAINLTR